MTAPQDMLHPGKCPWPTEISHGLRGNANKSWKRWWYKKCPPWCRAWTSKASCPEALKHGKEGGKKWRENGPAEMRAGVWGQDREARPGQCWPRYHLLSLRNNWLYNWKLKFMHHSDSIALLWCYNAILYKSIGSEFKIRAQLPAWGGT